MKMTLPTSPLIWWQDFAGIAALITAIASIPGTIAAIHLKKTRDEIGKEFQPNHGSSLVDKINLLNDSVKSVGHQVGEIRRDMAREHEAINHTLERHDKEIKEVRDAVTTIKILQ